MDNEIDNSKFYKFSEGGIKKRNIELYNKVISYFSSLNIEIDIPFKRKFYLYENLIVGLPKCYCGKSTNFIDMINGFRTSCSKKCAINDPLMKERRKNTCLEKWGVDNPSKLSSSKDKVKKTNLEKFGVEYPLMSNDIKEKNKKIFFDKYGVDNPSKIRSVREKAENTMLEKFGVRHAMLSEDIKQKNKEYFIDKYGVDNPYKVEEFREKAKMTMKERWGVEISTNKEILVKLKRSNLEKLESNDVERISEYNPIKVEQLYKFISSIYLGVIIRNYRDEKEIDIYLPELGIGFEFNGLYCHSEMCKDKLYHLDKTNHFKERGIRIIHIWEDDWDFKSEIIKSQIRNWLGLNKIKIFARKCVVKQISNTKLSKNFLNENHIQGYVNNIISIGLFFNDELVSIMTFDRSEGRVKMKDDEWNLSRFCNKMEYNVIGGASRLLNYFIKEQSPNRIISYADRDWSVGNLYNKLNFIKISESNPDYKYIVGGRRVHKSRYKKSNLGIKGSNITESEYMKSIGINRIFDCGKIKFELVTKNG